MVKIKINKKGDGSMMSLEEMVRTTLWILVFFLIIGLVYYIIDRGSDLGYETICRDSVLLRSKSDIKFGDTNQDIAEKVTPLLCNPIDKGTLKGDREEIKAQIANLAAKCWWMYAEGTITDLFKNEQDEKGCNVCYFFKIEGDLDKGTKSKRSFFPERGKNRREFHTDEILAEEMYNYLIDYDYNPKLAYGGGTKQYFGDDYEFTHDYDLEEDEIVVRNLKDVEDLSNSRVLDYTGKISEQTEEEINKIALEMIKQDRGELYVIVADEFKRNDIAEVRRLIERLDLNTFDEIYDAVIITIDLKNEQIRLTMGITLDQYINEFELNDLLKKHFSSRVTDINQPLLSLVKEIESLSAYNENAFFKEHNIGQKSYYAYLTNQGTTATIVSNIEAGKTYTVSYMSSSDELDWWSGIVKNWGAVDTVTAYILGGTALAIVAASIILSGGATIPAVITAATAAVAIQGTVTAGVIYSSAEDEDLARGLFALAGDATQAQPNLILISQLADVSAHCRIE